MSCVGGGGSFKHRHPVDVAVLVLRAFYKPVTQDQGITGLSEPAG